MSHRLSKFERSLRLLEIAGSPCIKCKTEARYFGEHCLDCWPGYELCKACGDYRCEHLLLDAEDLTDPEMTSCHCGNLECRAAFIEGSENRIINQAEFIALRQQWAAEASV